MEEALFNLAVIGLPIVGAVVLGAYWLRSVFKEVSLSDQPMGTGEVTKAERTVSALELQISVAEELGGVDPATLNSMRDELDAAKSEADRVRQEQEATVPAPVPVPWLSPVAAIHSAKAKVKSKDKKDQK